MTGAAVGYGRPAPQSTDISSIPASLHEASELVCRVGIVPVMRSLWAARDALAVEARDHEARALVTERLGDADRHWRIAAQRWAALCTLARLEVDLVAWATVEGRA